MRTSLVLFMDDRSPPSCTRRRASSPERDAPNTTMTTDWFYAGLCRDRAIVLGGLAGVAADVQGYTFTISTHEYRSLPIPSLEGAKIGDCFVKVTALPDGLDDFMEVNPRVPNRTQKGVLSGPVVKGIIETLTESPDDMAIKNQGIYLLVEDAEFTRAQGGAGKLQVTLADPNRHGIVNGGHTYAAIRDAIENADDVTRTSLARAHVRLHLLQGIDEARWRRSPKGSIAASKLTTHRWRTFKATSTKSARF
jgi:hypothetical protein